MAEIPDGLLYSEEHEWVRGDVSPGATVTVGITEYAAEALGDVVYVEPPTVGDEVRAGDVCGELESTKAVSEPVLARHRHGGGGQRAARGGPGPGQQRHVW
ncbi:hypothetical protein GCM10025876_17490 [Demequina litorisediminis]|uniref:Glycine cleavage system H protein n=1 Tax=Demequina litorisediminis TaxID=1849022 RepID=A0ABQ6ICM7_9MICO|nr:hypothetical protein GCM10025876_17490 [Demequina litorisediminis]